MPSVRSGKRAQSLGDTFITPHSSLPRVPAGERLIDWLGALPEIRDAQGRPISLPLPLRERMREGTFLGWAPKTRETYGSGIRNYLEFMSQYDVPRESWLPMSMSIARAWISSRIGELSYSAMSNYIAGVHALEAVNGLEPAVSKAALAPLLRAVGEFAPVKKAQRLPIRADLLGRMHAKLKHGDTFDIAWYACATTTFWCTSRPGEFTVPTLDGFQVGVHVSTLCIRERGGRDPITVFSLPWTKVGRSAGEDVFWAEQHGVSDPKAALRHHLTVNAPPSDGPLFAYRSGNCHKPLTYDRFAKRLYEICEALQIPRHHPHGLRIGNTLELLLSKGMSLEEVKAKGRWSSDAFKTYLREHAEVLAPLIQAHPRIREECRRFVPEIVR
jgi:hypothetical protein